MDTLREGLDAFESESCAPPAVLEVVRAYPDAGPRRAARASVRRPVTLRRLITSVFHAARTAALFPFVVTSWLLLRTWWLSRLLVEGVWHAIGDMLLPAAHDDGPPVIRVAMAGVPAWARGVRVVPAIAVALWTAAGISVGAAHVLMQRLPVRVPAPPAPAVSRPAPPPTLVTVILEPLPEPPVKE